MSAPGRTKRRWLQFRLRTLLILLTIIAAGLAWLTSERRRIAERREALNATGIKLNAVAFQPKWRIWLLGDDSHYYARVLDGTGSEMTDAAMVHLDGLTQMQRLLLTNCKITGDGLQHLSRLLQLDYVSLSHTHVGDAGLHHLSSLTQLKWLWLHNTQVTDAGLVHLERLTQLRHLSLGDTQVTDGGVARLKGALPNCLISR